MRRKVLRKLKYKFDRTSTIGDMARVGKSRNQWKRFKRSANVRCMDIWMTIGVQRTNKLNEDISWFMRINMDGRTVTA